MSMNFFNVVSDDTHRMYRELANLSGLAARHVVEALLHNTLGLEHQYGDLVKKAVRDWKKGQPK